MKIEGSSLPLLKSCLEVFENIDILIGDSSKYHCGVSFAMKADGSTCIGSHPEAVAWDWLGSIGRVEHKPLEQVHSRFTICQYYNAAVIELKYASVKDSSIFLSSYCVYEQFKCVLEKAQELITADIEAHEDNIE